MTNVVILDYGSGNIRSAQRALERAGATTVVTDDEGIAMNADGLVVPGVGAFASCMAGIQAVHGPRIIERRLAGGRPVLGICVGMQVMFDRGVEHGITTDGLGQWPGTVAKLNAEILPHMGWNTIAPPANTVLFQGLERERFYFVHSYAVQTWEFVQGSASFPPPKVTWTTHGEPFISAIENGPLTATQFHPEKSGEAGAAFLNAWVSTLR